MLCFWASLLAAALALLGREVPRPGVLGFWDEALAFAALASLARIGARGLGP